MSFNKHCMKRLTGNGLTHVRLVIRYSALRRYNVSGSK